MLKNGIRVNRYHNILPLFIGLLAFIFVAACGSTAAPGGVVSTSTSEAQGEISTSTLPTATSTFIPTETPQGVIFLAPPGADPGLVAELAPAVEALAQQDGLEFITLTEIPGDEIGENIVLVVVVPPDPGIETLAARNPQTQFLAIGIQDLSAGANITTIGADGERPDQQGFIAGYLAAVITPNWRVGVISNPDAGTGQAARDAFQNGVVFFCGLCRTSTPPYFTYPQFYDLPAGSGGVEIQSAVAFMQSNAVQTIYVYPEVGDEQLYQGLADAGISIVGGVTPPLGFEASWVATIRPDYLTPLQDVWSRVLAGNGGLSLAVPIVIQDQNEGLFSAGRQRVVEDTLSDLLSGFIGTGVDPASGE